MSALHFLKSATFKLLIPLAVITYLFGLDSLYVPKNGDENPYMHIARMTAATEQWLPLQSELDNMRNTKPPLLFWQGMVSTHGAAHWNLFDLRLPSVIYTFLTALFLFFTVKHFSKKTETGIIAALVWLSFIGTYRYGRPYLTEPPEIFWLSLPFFALLYWGKGAFASKWLFPLFAALSMGIALLYKSFFYVVPAGLALTLWYGCWRDWNIGLAVRRDAFKVLMIGVISLAIFSLWFVLDPTPETIWREFVLGENVGKIDPYSGSYLQHLLWGRKSLFSFIVATFINAGFFIFVSVAAFWYCWRKRHMMQFEEKCLWLLILSFFLAFSLPSHRSGRYLLPIMPAMAALIALHWRQLPLWGFRLALLMQMMLIMFFYWLGWDLQGSTWLNTTSVWNYPVWHWALLIVALVAVFIGLANKECAKLMALAGSFLCYCALVSSLSPLDGPLGHYNEATIKQVQNQHVWIPCSFRAKNEEYRLLLPGAHLHGYSVKEAKQLDLLAERYSTFVAYVPQGKIPELCAGCKIMGGRVHMLTRQRAHEIKSILSGKVGTYLFVNEYLISAPAESSQWLSPANLLADACR